MSQLHDGARQIERRTQALARENVVAIVDVFWNGDEGLRPNDDTQTLFVASTQKTGRATLTRDQVEACAEADTPPPDVEKVLHTAVVDAAVAARQGDHPVGGGG